MSREHRLMQASVKRMAASSAARVPVKRVGWMRRLVADILFVARRDRTWWLLPLVVMVLLFAALIVVGTALGPLAPFLYPLF